MPDSQTRHELSGSPGAVRRETPLPEVGTPTTALAADADARPADRQGQMLVVLCAAQFMLALDVTVVTVALPVVQQTLRVTPSALQWVTTAYTLAFGGFLMLTGRLADLLGRRRLLVAGVTLFTVASMLCALAQRGWELFAARGLQGLGAAVAVPAALSLLTTSFPEGAPRNRAMGAWSAIATAGAVTGYVVGGLVTASFGWRYVFLVNLPVGALLLWRVLRLFPADQPRGATRTDLPGAVTLTGGIVLIVYAITSVPGTGVPLGTVVAGLVGVVLLASFVLLERRHPAPLIRFGIFGNRNVVAGNLVNVANAATSSAVIFLTSLYLQRVAGLSAFETGLAFAPVSIEIMIVSKLVPRLLARLPARRLLVAGAGIAALGVLWLSRAPVDGSYLTDVLPGILLTGLGAGLTFAPSMLVATTGVADEEQGMASGLIGTAQQLGGAVGLAALATVATARSDAVGGPDGLAAGFQAGYLGALLLPALTVVAALVIRPPRSQPAVGTN